MCCVLIAGPREEELAMLPASGMAAALDIETLTKSPAAKRALMRVAKACCITSAGANAVPPPKENDTASLAPLRN